jgi:L-asparaginase
MAYTASALSFMLRKNRKPVILTGSQIPLCELRNDARDNLVTALLIAASDAVHEVCLYFGGRLLRGNRTLKYSADDLVAFISPNYPPLAEAGINIRYNNSLVLRPESWDKAPSWNTGLDTRVSILKVHPGITPQTVRDILLGPGTRAVIMETYGSGNAISKPWFVEIVREAVSQGKILLNVTQCQKGDVNMDLYATGRALKEAGVVSGYDSTTESALGKLFYLLGTSADNEFVKVLLARNLKGEISK